MNIPHLAKRDAIGLIIPHNVQDREASLQSPGVHDDSDISIEHPSLSGSVGEGTPQVTLLGITILLGIQVVGDAVIEDVIRQEMIHHA